MCRDLIEEGENPACVDSCTMRAIEWGDVEELKAKYGEDSVKDLPVLPDSSKTKPSVFIKAKAEASNREFILKED